MLPNLFNRTQSRLAATRRRWAAGLATAFIAGCSLTTNAQAATTVTYTVTGHDDPAQVTCIGTVCNSLRAAVWNAENLHPTATIQLGSGTYELGTSTWNRPLNITTNLNIIGAGQWATTIKQDADADEVIIVGDFSASVGISNLTVTGGHHIGSDASLPADAGTAMRGAPATGGLQTNGALVLDHVSVTGNSAAGGRGEDATGSLTGGRGGDAAGGIEVIGSLLLENSRVINNTAVAGAGGDGLGTGAGGVGGGALGGIDIWSGHTGPVKIINSIVSNNTATAGGGGASHSPASEDGLGGPAYGAIAAFAPLSPVTIVNSVINGNTTTGGAGGSGTWGATGGRGGEAEGGGVYITSQQLSLTGTTIDGNTATGGRGGTDVTRGGQAGPAIGGGVAVLTSGGLAMRDSTVVFSSVTAGAAGSAINGRSAPVAAGGDAMGGGVLATGTNTIVNSTITSNRATGSKGGSVPGSASVGTPGRGLGGGVFMQTPGSLALANDTIVTNAVVSQAGNPASGGNLYDNQVNVQMADTIVSTGIGSAGAANCTLTPHSLVDQGHNLESSKPSQCGLTQSSDKIGVDPQMGTFGNFGGASPLFSLRATSPARGAGGACTDLTVSGSPPLTVDGRGQPRTGSCDIGAFQTQAPSFTQSPQILTPASGTVSAPAGTSATAGTVGDQLTCVAPQAHGDGSISSTVSWLRDGTAIANGPAYTVRSVDAGAALSCSVVATNLYGTATATSAALPISASSV